MGTRGMNTRVTPLTSAPKGKKKVRFQEGGNQAPQGTLWEGESGKDTTPPPHSNSEASQGSGTHSAASSSPSSSSSSSSSEEIHELQPDSGPGPQPSGPPGPTVPFAFSSPQVFPENLWATNWTTFYENCQIWKSVWEQAHTPSKPWPKGIKIFQDRMFFEEKLCVPVMVQEKIVMEHHIFLGHLSGKKLWRHLDRQYHFATFGEVKKFALSCGRRCPSCEACTRPENLHLKISSSVIPPYLMHSVAVDLFHMPPVKWEGENYDIMAVCVDRLSGWIVAVPGQNKGLTGAKVAKAMLKTQWRPFGIPSLITSDQGSHFTGEWWRTMCANLGIRQAYSQAYHHQANGRAEMAGQLLLEKLRKIQVEEKKNWVELLPAVVDRYHDIPGESGLSPYQTLFGRERPLANLPYLPPKECEDANQFFKRMKEIDKSVAKLLNDLHQKQVEKINQKRQDPQPFQPGDMVYYRRPEGSGSKLDSRWLGPAVVVAREGNRSYLVQIREGVTIKAHLSFLKPCTTKIFQGTPVPLFYHQRTVVDPEAQVDEWIVDKILRHRINKQGNIEFLTTWKGYEIKDATWEPVKNFIHRYNSDFLQYCQNKNLTVNITHQLDIPKGEG